MQTVVACVVVSFPLLAFRLGGLSLGSSVYERKSRFQFCVLSSRESYIKEHKHSRFRSCKRNRRKFRRRRFEFFGITGTRRSRCDHHLQVQRIRSELKYVKVQAIHQNNRESLTGPSLNNHTHFSSTIIVVPWAAQWLTAVQE